MKKTGEKNIYLLSSKDIIGHDGEATVDGIHFTDLGFMRYAEVLYPLIKNISGKFSILLFYEIIFCHFVIFRCGEIVLRYINDDN